MSSPTLKEVEGKDSENSSNSSSSNGEGGGINSDNSALVSFGNTSFGFNFESDGGFNNSSGTNSPDEGDSDQGERKPKPSVDGKPCQEGTKVVAPAGLDSPGSAAPAGPASPPQLAQPQAQAASQPQAPDPVVVKVECPPPSAVGSSTGTAATGDAPPAPAPLSAGAAAAQIQSNAALKPSPLSPHSALSAAGTHHDAAATAVANLNQIATDSVERTDAANEGKSVVVFSDAEDLVPPPSFRNARKCLCFKVFQTLIIRYCYIVTNGIAAFLCFDHLCIRRGKEGPETKNRRRQRGLRQ